LPGTGAGKPVRRFARVIIQPHSWRNLLSLSVGLPLGVAWLALFSLALAGGMGLVVILAGAPALTAFLSAARRASAFDSRVTERLRGNVAPPPHQPTPQTGLLANLEDPRTWRAIGYLLARGPLAAISLAIPAALLVAGAALTLAPATGGWAIDPLGYWRAASMSEFELLATTLLGVLLTLTAFHAANALAALNERVGRAVLAPAYAK
jgi:hypothetical protein